MKDDLIGQYHETMGKSTRHKELTVIVFCKFDSNMLPERRRTSTDIHCDIKHGTLYDPHELALTERGFLEMQSSENAIR